MRIQTAVIMFALGLCACGIPRDPEGTLDRVTGGTMRVGITESSPWVEFGDAEPTGVEAELVQDLAEAVDAEIEWVDGSEEELFAALEVNELDLVIGGLTATTPWSSVAGITHPYLTTATIVAVPRGDAPPEDIAGLKVGVEANTSIAGLLRKTDARVVEVTSIQDHDGPVAIDNFLADDLEVVDTGVRLDESDHVFAVPRGENDWMTSIERFLLERPDEIENLIEEFGKP